MFLPLGLLLPQAIERELRKSGEELSQAIGHVDEDERIWQCGGWKLGVGDVWRMFWSLWTPSPELFMELSGILEKMSNNAEKGCLAILFETEISGCRLPLNFSRNLILSFLI